MRSIQKLATFVAGAAVITLQSLAHAGVAVARLTPSGFADSGFGPNHDGYFIGGNTTDTVNAGIVHLDRPLYVGSYSTGPTTARMYLARLGTGGTGDPSFGWFGVAPAEYDHGATLETAIDITSDASRRYVVLGTSLVTLANPTSFVARFLENGLVDTTFGTNGFAVVPAGAKHIVLNPQDDRIMITGTNSAGIWVSGLSPDGRRQPYYVTGLRWSTGAGAPTDVVNDIAVHWRGSFAICGGPGTTQGGFGVMQFNIDGVLDSNFDGDGKKTIPFDLSYKQQVATALRYDKMNRLVVVGAGKHPTDATQDPMFVVRIGPGAVSGGAPPGTPVAQTNFWFGAPLATRSFDVQTSGEDFFVSGTIKSGNARTLVTTRWLGALFSYDQTYGGAGNGIAYSPLAAQNAKLANLDVNPANNKPVLMAGTW